MSANTTTPSPKYELKDFDLLKILKTRDKNIKIAKVRYKKDNKIYCIRKVKKGNYLDDDINELKETLTKINHPHIIKYYDIFEEKNNLYFLMEYIDIDIKDYIESYNLMNKKVPEETIFFLLMQCLSALKYIYSNPSIKKLKGIKLSNILMPTERGIKIALIKDDLSNDVNESDEIELLYKYFELIMFPERFKDGQSIKAYLPDKQNNSYDKELREIIYNMKDGNPRNAQEILKKTESYYIDKKYKLKDENKNTSIKSVFKCLSNCEKLKKYLDKQTLKDNDYLLINIIKEIFDDGKVETYYPAIEKLRRLIALEYSAFDDIKEINPIIIINFILKCEEILEKNSGKEITISKLFSVQKKVTRICSKCKTKIQSDEKENTITFDMCKINKNIFNLSLEGFKNNNNSKEIKKYCDKCKAYQNFDGIFSYNEFSDYLIVYFDRGNNFKNATKIIFGEKLEVDLSSNGKGKVKFELIGCIIKKMEGKNYIFENIKVKDNNFINEQDKIMILIYQKK